MANSALDVSKSRDASERRHGMLLAIGQTIPYFLNRRSAVGDEHGTHHPIECVGLLDPRMPPFLYLRCAFKPCRYSADSSYPVSTRARLDALIAFQNRMSWPRSRFRTRAAAATHSVCSSELRVALFETDMSRSLVNHERRASLCESIDRSISTRRS